MQKQHYGMLWGKISMPVWA